MHTAKNFLVSFSLLKTDLMMLKRGLAADVWNNWKAGLTVARQVYIKFNTTQEKCVLLVDLRKHLLAWDQELLLAALELLRQKKAFQWPTDPSEGTTLCMAHPACR